jgi:hypothetical protein
MADDQGTSVEERAANGEHEYDEELFPRGVVEHDGKGIDVIFRRHRTKVDASVVLSRAEVPLRGGLLEVDTPVHLLTRAEVSHYVPKPTRGPDGRQDGWHVQTVLKSAYTSALGDTQGAMVALFRDLLEVSPQEAAVALDRLQRTMSDHLTR